MKALGRIFVSGLAAVVPIALTVAVLVWLGVKAESLLGGMARWLLPDAIVFPGLGLILGVALVFGIGILMQLWVVQRLFELGEAMLERIPLIKTLYGSIRDVMQMFSRKDGRETGKPVMVKLPGRNEALMGFQTRDNLGGELGDEDTVAVYLPMSYQIGGYTLLLPRDCVVPLDLGAQEAMRFVLTAGLGQSNVDSPDSRDSRGKSPGEAAAGPAVGQSEQRKPRDP